MAEEDVSKIPIPQDEEDDADSESYEVQIREPDTCTKPLVKDFEEKYLKESVFTGFKKDIAEVTTDIAKHLEADVSTT